MSGGGNDDQVSHPSTRSTQGPGTGNGNGNGSGDRTGRDGHNTSSGSNNDPSSPTSGTRSHDRIASTSTTTSRPEGYPSWLPRRPAGPVPTGSSVGDRTRPGTAIDSPYDEDEDPMAAFLAAGGGEQYEADALEDPTVIGPSTGVGERKATPRAVRIVRVPGTSTGGIAMHHVQQSSATAVPGESREASDSTRVPSSAYPAGARISAQSPLAHPMSPTTVNTSPTSRGTPAMAMAARRVRHSVAPPVTHIQRSSHFLPPPPPAPFQRPPRFRARKFHPTLLKDESILGRLNWYLWCIFVGFGCLILQMFLDFNIAYMLGQ